MRKTAFWAAVGVMLVGILGSATFALAHGFKKDVRGELNGYNEALSTLSTSGYGSFKAKIDDKADKIEYTLTYNDLEGDVTQAHIHLGRPSLNGGIMVWLCQTAAATTPTPGVPTCPAGHSGTVSGTLTPANVIGPAAQGIAAGEFDEVVAAIRAGAAYANVHTTKYPGGEIRAPLGGKGHGHK